MTIITRSPVSYEFFLRHSGPKRAGSWRSTTHLKIKRNRHLENDKLHSNPHLSQIIRHCQKFHFFLNGMPNQLEPILRSGVTPPAQ
jgi:hypothetical protein